MKKDHKTESTPPQEAGALDEEIERASEAVAVQARALGELADGASGDDAGDGIGIEGLLDVAVRVTVEVGRIDMELGELVRLTPGSVLELDRAAHEPADVLVNGKVVARGEVVTVDDRYGVRITEVT